MFKVPIAANCKGFCLQNTSKSLTSKSSYNMAIMTLWIGNGAVPVKRILKKKKKKNKSWPELFNFQYSFDCHWLELLRTAPLPVHKVIIIAIF